MGLKTNDLRSIIPIEQDVTDAPIVKPLVPVPAETIPTPKEVTPRRSGRIRKSNPRYSAEDYDLSVTSTEEMQG